MKIKLQNLAEFSNIYSTLKNGKMPFKTAYKFNKIFTQIDTELTFYQQKFADIVREFGKQDENGNYIYTQDGSSIEIMEGRQLECQQKIAELQNIEADIPDVYFSIDELESFDLTIQEMNCLMPFIKE